MTATSYHFKDIVPSPAQNWNQMVPPVSIEGSHENRNVFIGVLSLGKNIRRPSPMARLEQIRPCRNLPRPRSNQGGDSQKTTRRAIRLLTTSRGEGFRSVAIAADGQVELSGTIGKSRRRAATQSISVSSAPRIQS